MADGSQPTPERPRRGDDAKPSWKVDPAPDGRGGKGEPADAAQPARHVHRRDHRAAGAELRARAGHRRARRPHARSPTSRSSSTRSAPATCRRSRRRDQTIEGTLKAKATYTPPKGKAQTVDRFTTQVPAFVDTVDLTKLLDQKNVVVNASAADGGRSPLLTLLLGFGPTLLLVGIFVYLARRMSSGGALGGFGRSLAKRVKPEDQARVTFDDVAGIDEAENELVEIVDFLKNPKRYQRLGARIPRGVLLYGPPGTGKTLLARAVAGEAKAAFFSISASEFVEAIVGVGASRVRDLFKQAKEAAPAIVFVDELDAIGRSRAGQRQLRRRQRRARADAEPDPHRDGRLRRGHERDRPRRDEPPRGARLRAAAPRALRPPHRRAGARQDGPRGDPAHPHALGAARRLRRPRRDRRVDARAWSAPTSRCWSTRPRCSPRAGTTTRCSRATSPTRSRRSSSAPSAPSS